MKLTDQWTDDGAGGIIKETGVQPETKSDRNKRDASKPTAEEMTHLIENTPCILTEKKFSGYFLKPGAKHAKEFFDVGYTEEDALRLRYDIANQYNFQNAVDFKETGNGTIGFNIYMDLGIVKKKQFLTGWRIDAEGEAPRIITCFRRDV